MSFKQMVREALRELARQTPELAESNRVDRQRELDSMTTDHLFTLTGIDLFTGIKTRNQSVLAHVR